jgi:UDP-galactopyranose mutase
MEVMSTPHLSRVAGISSVAPARPAASRRAFDFLIVGAGPFGATFARRVAELGHRCLVIDRRDHLAGNCHTVEIEGVKVHRYGPHIFHTADEKVWSFVQEFATFNDYRHQARVIHQGRAYPFPINLQTLRDLWKIETAEEAEAILVKVRVPLARPRSLRDWLLSQLGEELYTIFFRDYTRKQWGRDPADLPASIVQRIPFRTTDSDFYFGDAIRYTGIPIGGYTKLFTQMLDHPAIRVELGVDYFSLRDYFDECARQLVYAGKIDAFFNYQFGHLSYRSLRFVDQRHTGWHQAVAMVNYADADVPFTRQVEHKHFEPTNTPATIVTREYPEEHTPDNEPYYPIRDDVNVKLLSQYARLTRATSVIFGGRLGSYRYINMDQAIAEALKKADQYLGIARTGWRQKSRVK